MEDTRWNIPRDPGDMSIVSGAANSIMTIRAARPGDAEAIAGVFLDSARLHADLDPERYLVPSADDVAARYANVTSQHNAEATTLVAEIDGALVGFVDARLERSPDPMHRDIVYCHVSEIAVGNRYQGHGIGAQLLHAAEEWGRQRGATFASLEHHVANTRAAAFYERRMGYTVAAAILIKPLPATA